MKGLTTHVLDTVRGVGAVGMRVDVRMPSGKSFSAVLDASGRAVLLRDLAVGTYDILFFAGTYFGEAKFYDVIPVRFLVDDGEKHYHVPLILSAFGYSTYRGG